MRIKLISALTSGLLVASSFAAANAVTAKSSDYIVVYKNNMSTESTTKSLGKLGIKPKAKYDKVFNGIAASLTDAQAASLRSNANVKYIEKDVSMHSSATQNNPPSWGIDRIDQSTLPLDGKFNYQTNAGAGVKVYVVDTGVNAKLPDFGGRVVKGCNAVGKLICSPSRSTNDDNGHGTHVAGTIAGTQYGVAKKAKIVAVKVLDQNGGGSSSSVIAGLNWVISNHKPGEPAVLNMSLGGAASQLVDDAINAVIDNGITVVVAAGNSNTDACTNSPARVQGAITVGAVGDKNVDPMGQNDNISPYSNYGPCVDVFAPGTFIMSDWFKGGATALSGTSMASPHVAGVAALWLAKKPTMTPAQVASAIVSDGNSAQVVVLTDQSSGTTNKLVQVPNS